LAAVAQVELALPPPRTDKGITVLIPRFTLGKQQAAEVVVVGVIHITNQLLLVRAAQAEARVDNHRVPTHMVGVALPLQAIKEILAEIVLHLPLMAVILATAQAEEVRVARAAVLLMVLARAVPAVVLGYKIL
jgi:hypothetical protein